MFNNKFINYTDTNNDMNVSKMFIAIKCEEFNKSKLSDNEMTDVKTNILGFYIEILHQIKSRFYNAK